MIYLNGGLLYVDASGDGLDANGSIEMNGGTVIVNGPTNSGNGALDYDGTFSIKGGTLVAAGSSGMAQTPSSTSSQPILSIGTSFSEGTLINIKSENGEDIFTFAPAKSGQSIIISTPALTSGATYTVSSGGTSSGVVTDGIYTEGSYSGGTEIGSVTLSNTITTIGQTQGSMGGAAGMGGMGGKGQRPMN